MIEQLQKAATHDLGGQSRFLCTPVDRDDDHGPPDEFGRKVDALRLILGAARLVSVDELRRGVEALDPHEYETLDYYERWLRAIAMILVEKGVLHSGDLP